MRLKKTFCLLSVLLVFWAKSAWALDMEYYTYGGFDLMVQAFNIVALIFSDTDFRQLMYVFAVFGLLGGAIAWLAAVSSGQRDIPLLWVGKVIVGAALYFALFVPTGHIALYDATLNKTQTIGGVPDGIVFVAGSFNKLERAIVSICDTVTGPVSSYSANAGGIGFGLLSDMSNSQDIYATMSMEEYMDKCVLFETMRTGGTIGFADLTGNNTDFMTTLANAVNPAVFTIYYDSTTPGGVPVTCTDAWTKLQPFYVNPANYNDALSKTCSNGGINSSDPVELAACQTIISNTTNIATGTNYSYDTILRQSQLSAMLYHTFMGNAQTSAALQANRNITSSGFGVGTTMDEWIPIIKSILTSIAICLTPFLVLLLPTPYVGKSVAVMFGFFTFLAIWGIADAVIHLGAIVYAGNAFRGIGPSNLGMLAMAAIPTLSAKTLAMFGYFRSAGMMLSAVITGLLIRFGGSALAHLAGGLTGVAVQGGQAGGRMYTPEGRTAEQQELLRAWSTMGIEGQERFSNRGRAMAMEEERRIKMTENLGLAAHQAEAEGRITPGSADSLGVQAGMLSGAMNLATNSGKFSPVFGPDGKMIMADNISPTGSKLSFSYNGSGGPHLNSAAINGMDPIKMTDAAIQMNIQGASHAIAKNHGIERFLSEARQAGGTDATSRAQSDSLNKTFAANFERNIGENSDFSKTTDWQEVKQLKNFLGAHGGISENGVGASIGMDGNLQLQGADGHKFSMKVSEATANALRHAEGSAWSEALNRTASTQEGLAWASSIAQKSGNTEAFSLLNEARNMSRAQQTTGENLTAAFLTDYASHHFDGSTTPEALQTSADYLSYKITNGGLAGQEFVHRAYADFYGRRGGFGSETAAAVQRGINEWGGQATGGAPAGVQPALSRARAETNSIIPDAFQGGQNVGPWSENAKGIQSRMDNKALEINTGAHDRARKDHYNVEQGGSVLGTIQKPPETEQEALHLTPEFNKEMNRIVQHTEGADQSEVGNR